jgi:hypothetical protein
MSLRQEVACLENFTFQLFYEISMASCARQEEDAPMETTPPPARPGWEHRLHAVLALLGGEPVPEVPARFGMGRSILYTWRHRALTALQGVLASCRARHDTLGCYRECSGERAPRWTHARP